MRILHVARQYAPSIGGIQSFVSGLARAQRDAGESVTVATLLRSQISGEALGPSKEVIDGIAVNRLGHFGPRQYSIAPGVLRLVSGHDIVHVHSFDFFCDYLALTQWVHRTPMVIQTHGLFFHSNNILPLKKLYLQTVTACALIAYRRVLASSEMDKARLGAVAEGRVRVAPSGVDSDFFQVPRRPNGPTLLAFAGAEHKRIDLLIEAYRIARKRIPHLRLILVGRQRASADPAILVTGVLSRSELMNQLSRTTLLCSSSDYEGFGLGTAEALAAGVPAAVRPDNPLAAFSKRGALFIIDFRSPQRAADQLTSILRDRSLLSAASLEARELAQQFQWPRVERTYHDIYREVTGSR
jgi:alpha-1,3-mannosyltransferase